MNIDLDPKELGLLVEAAKSASEAWGVCGNESRAHEYEYLYVILESVQGHYVNEQIKAII